MCKKLCETPRHLICGHLNPQMRGRDRAHSMILKLVHPTRDRVTLHDKVKLFYSRMLSIAYITIFN